MHSHPKTRLFEFCFVAMDYTLIRVEECEGEVTIRATEDTFGEPQKLQFIQHLADEGFIPPECRWYSLAGKEGIGRGVRWVVDNRWLEEDAEIAADTRRWIRRLLAPATLLWLLAVYLAVPTPAKAMPPPSPPAPSVMTAK